jgi:hypothetical protein
MALGGILAGEIIAMIPSAVMGTPVDIFYGRRKIQ